MSDAFRMRAAALLTVLAIPLWVASFAAGNWLGARPGNWALAAVSMLTFVAVPMATAWAGWTVAWRAPSAPIRTAGGLVVAMGCMFVPCSAYFGWRSADPRWDGLHREHVGSRVLPALHDVREPRDEGTSGTLVSTERSVKLEIRWFPASWPPDQVGAILTREAPGTMDDTWEYEPDGQSWSWPHGESNEGRNGVGRTVPCGKSNVYVLIWGPPRWSTALLDMVIAEIECSGPI